MERGVEVASNKEKARISQNKRNATEYSAIYTFWRAFVSPPPRTSL